MKNQTVNDYFRHHWVKLMLFALFTAAVSFFAPLKNFQLKWLIDSKSKQEALGYMGLVFLITFTSWFFERLSRRSFTKLACGAVEQVRGQVMERVLRRPVSQYQREGDAAYLSLLTTDLRTLYDDYYMSIFNIVFWGGIMLCALGMYLYISPVMLAAILLVTVPPLVLPRKMNERLKASRDAFSLQMAGYTQQLKELLGGFEVIRGFLREDAYAARHRDAARQARDSEQAYQQSLNAMVVNTSLISNLIFPIVMLVGLFLAFDGRLTMGTVSTAASMANFVITPCNQIAQCWAKVRSSKGIRQRLEAAMSGPEKVSAGRAIDKLEHIECKDTGFAYPGAAAPVLRGVRLTVSGQEKAVLVGESGCGKSTLAKHFNAILLPESGTVLVEGMDTKDEDKIYDIRQTVGMVFQSPDNQIVATVVEEDVAFALENLGVPPEEMRRRVDEAMKMAGIYEYRERAPHNLSGGQKQRVAIAGVVAMRPDCLILDEATAMLDPRGREQVMQTIHHLNKNMGITVVSITHYMEEAAQADRVLVMSKGNVVMEGTPKEVFSQTEKVRALRLDVPQAAELRDELVKAGIPMPEGIIDTGACAQALYELLK